MFSHNSRFSINKRRAKKIALQILVKLNLVCDNSDQFKQNLTRKYKALTPNFPNYAMLNEVFSDIIFTKKAQFNPYIESYLSKLHKKNYKSALDELMILAKRTPNNESIDNSKNIDNKELRLILTNVKRQFKNIKDQYFCGVLCTLLLLMSIPLFLVHTFVNSHNHSLTCSINPTFLTEIYIFTIYSAYLIREIGNVTGITSVFIIILGYVTMSLNYEVGLVASLLIVGFGIPILKRMFEINPIDYYNERLERLQELMQKINPSTN